MRRRILMFVSISNKYLSNHSRSMEVTIRTLFAFRWFDFSFAEIQKDKGRGSCGSFIFRIRAVSK